MSGSSPCARPASLIARGRPEAGLAQLAEQRFCKPWVGGSSPSTGTKKTSKNVCKRLKFIDKLVIFNSFASARVWWRPARKLVYSLVSSKYRQGVYQHSACRTRGSLGEGRRQNHQIVRWRRTPALDYPGWRKALAPRLSLRGRAEGSGERRLSHHWIERGPRRAPRRETAAGGWPRSIGGEKADGLGSIWLRIRFWRGRSLQLAIAPSPGIAPGGHLPRMIMPSTSSLVMSCTRPLPTIWPFFITVTRSARSKTS